MKTTLWIAILVAALAYTGFFLSLSNVPFIDAPDHMARAVIMKSLWFDPHSPFQGKFSAARLFMPYMLPDLGLMLLLKTVGPRLAYPVWSTATMLALALAIWVYARQLLATSWAVAAAVLCSWFFATDYFLILGFFAFQWGLAAAFLALGAMEAWRKNKENTFGWIALYAAACFVAYGTHIACFAILAALVGMIGFLRVLRKEQSWGRLGWELLPLAILAAYHLLLVPAHPEAIHGQVTHSTIANKVGRFFGSIFIRKSYAMDGAILLLFLAIIAGALRPGIGRRFDLRNRWELATICLLAVVGYFLLPVGWGAGYYVDMRFLPFFFIPLLMFALGSLESSGADRRQIALLAVACCVLATANLASLAWFLPRQNGDVGLYRQAIDTIPAGRMVLPIDTGLAEGRTRPLLHAGSLYEVDRGGYTPYVPSANRGGPAAYFLELSSSYRPELDWYVSSEAPDWEELMETYDYVIVTKPWRPERIDLSRLELQYENPAASVFRMRR
jgi:hypothetical protein